MLVDGPFSQSFGCCSLQAIAWYGKHDVRVVERPVPTITDPVGGGVACGLQEKAWQ
jgi:hypothetical protein